MENRSIPLTFQCSLLHIPIRHPTEWEMDNLPRYHFTSKQPWDPESVNDDTKGKVVYPDGNDVEDSMSDYLRTINFAEIGLDTEISDSDVTAMLA